MRKTEQEKIETITCDRCKSPIATPDEIITFASWAWSEQQDDLDFDTIPCLIKHLINLDPNINTSLPDISDDYHYSISMSGTNLSKLVEFLRSNLPIEEVEVED